MPAVLSSDIEIPLQKIHRLERSLRVRGQLFIFKVIFT